MTKSHSRSKPCRLPLFPGLPRAGFFASAARRLTAWRKKKQALKENHLLTHDTMLSIRNIIFEQLISCCGTQLEKYMNKTALTLGTLIALSVTACGGGSSSAVPPAPVPSKLAAYVGTWARACEYQSISSVVIAEAVGVKDSNNETFKTEYYAQEGCTGAVIATTTYSAGMTQTYTGTVDAAVAAAEGSPSVMTKIDVVSESGPSYTRSTTGTNVIQKVSNGVPMTCVDFGGGSQTCMEDVGVFPALDPRSAGIYRNGEKMYWLRPSGSIYISTLAFTKK